MSGQVIFFSVVLGAAAVGMDSKVPVLERYLL
jgi:Na+/H+-dicarboxylate symporter